MKKWILVFAMALGVGAVGWVYVDAHRPYQGYRDSVIFTIQPGERAPEVAQLLSDRGVVSRRVTFLALYALGRMRHETLKAGEYLFDRPATPLDVYEQIAQGKVYFHVVVIPEGSDRFDMARILQQRLNIDPGEFLRVTGQTALIRDLDPAAPTVEGYLFPDSYRFPQGASAALVAETMVTRFRQVLHSELQDFDPASQKLHNIITLASMVEKETPEAVERPMIAGVFRRRLEKGMLLECDPTAAYAARLAEGGTGSPAAPITERDLNSSSPFNTYRHSGLPPGPICSPGAASIRATLDPASGDALYFVSNNHGGHVFATTLAEHEHNVARYRREVAMLRRAEGSAPRAADPESMQNQRHESSVQTPAARKRQGAESKKQKGHHSRVPRGAEPRAGGASGNPPDSN